jgi:hypothetical protein
VQQRKTAQNGRHGVISKKRRNNFWFLPKTVMRGGRIVRTNFPTDLKRAGESELVLARQLVAEPVGHSLRRNGFPIRKTEPS